MRSTYLLVLAVIFISACAQQQAKFENNGIKIIQFTANPSEVNEKQEVDFGLEIENVGSTTATQVKAELINVRNIWEGSIEKPPVTMKPGSLKDNTPGDIKFFQWTLRAPDLPEGVAAPLDVKARVTYGYSSTQVIRITALNTNQKRILDNRGEVIANPIVVAQDDFSPVKVSITRGPVPLIIDPDPSDPINEASYRLEIVNVGDGWPITDNKIGLVRGTINGRGSGISLLDCSGGSGDFKSNGATLRADGTAPIICTLVIDKPQWQGGPKEDSFLFTIDLRYTYFVERTAPVTVHGRGGGVSGGGTSGGTSGDGGSSGSGSSGGLTLCGLPVADQSTYDKCSAALNRHGGDCNGNWCVAPGSSDEYCCITSSCRSGFGTGSSITIQIDGAGTCR